MALAVLLWMLSGLAIQGQPADDADRVATDAAVAPFRVGVSEIEAETIQRHIVAQGQVKPERAATLRALTAGQVEAVLVESGERVDKDTVLVRLAMDDRESRLQEARALLQQRQREHEAAQRLGASGLQSEVKQDEAAAALASARAALRWIELDIEHTRIKAPFDGIVDEVLVEVGDYASGQNPVATVVDNSPLMAEVYLSQRHFDSVTLGGEASVTLVSGDTRTGRITTVSPRAEESSRTFRIEIRVPNPGGVPANTSAEVVIPTGMISAHRVSPSLLELDDAGNLGAKIVTDSGQVAFTEVEIVRSDPRGVWVTGLPARVRVITVGGGFVTPGQVVDTEHADAG